MSVCKWRGKPEEDGRYVEARGRAPASAWQNGRAVEHPRAETFGVSPSERDAERAGAIDIATSARSFEDREPPAARRATKCDFSVFKSRDCAARQVRSTIAFGLQLRFLPRAGRAETIASCRCMSRSRRIPA